MLARLGFAAWFDVGAAASPWLGFTPSVAPPLTNVKADKTKAASTYMASVYDIATPGDVGRRGLGGWV